MTLTRSLIGVLVQFEQEGKSVIMLSLSHRHNSIIDFRRKGPHGAEIN